MTEPDYIRPLLQQLLVGREPELGARLKQRLNALLSEKRLPRFDEKLFGYRKFHSFLEQTQGDWLRVTKPEGAGDIHVAAKMAKPTPSGAGRAAGASTQPIRSDVWQAFTNPDAARRRYYQPSTGLIVHYLQSEQSPRRAEIEGSAGAYQEIRPIGGALQQQWMREFLDSIPITGSERAPYEALLAEPYSSALNATFTRALGDHANAWREFRTSRVINAIWAWASEVGVPAERLRVTPKEVRFSERAEPVFDAVASSRVQASKLLDLIADEDIRRVVIPILLSTLMVKNRS